MKSKENVSERKLRGGYYTPADLAMFAAKWACAGGAERVLEPSCGDGVFLDAVSRLSCSGPSTITAFELDLREAGKARARARRGNVPAQVHGRDFLEWATNELDGHGQPFDAAVGNPPFIRYQHLPDGFQVHAERIFRRLGCRFTKHTNAWVPFVLASVALLRPGGRLGMVVPSEIMNVAHSQPLRTFLQEHCRRIAVIDPEELWFAGTLQGAVMLLVEKRLSASDKSHGLAIIPVRDKEFASRCPDGIVDRARFIDSGMAPGKWTRARLGATTLQLLRDLAQKPSVRYFSSVADVDVGIITGANKFFLVPSDTVDRFGLGNYAHPMFGRSEHCPGILYDKRQHRENASAGKPTNFIWLPGAEAARDRHVRKYVEFGESLKLHTRFKCRVRSPWYSVPSVYATEIGLLKRSHNAPRLILNRARAFTTDTAYRIRPMDTPAEKLVCCFLNPLTSLSAEIEGRHYGGGVLELVPSEVEALAIPLPDGFEPDIEALDKAVRSRPIADVVADNGRRVLGALGVSGTDQGRLIDAWWTLRNRRHRVPSGADDPRVASQSR